MISEGPSDGGGGPKFRFTHPEISLVEPILYLRHEELDWIIGSAESLLNLVEQSDVYIIGDDPETLTLTHNQMFTLSKVAGDTNVYLESTLWDAHWSPLLDKIMESKIEKEYHQNSPMAGKTYKDFGDNTSIEFTPKEADHVSKGLSEYFDRHINEMDVLHTLIESFEKADTNIHANVPIQFHRDHSEYFPCTHCYLNDLLKTELDLMSEFIEEPDNPNVQGEYEKMALLCTILAKLNGPSEDNGGDSGTSAAAAA